jgi:YD repeat-containing protein
MTIASKYVKITTDDGAVTECYYDGEDRLHSEDGPASIERKGDGSLVETFYRHGQLFRPDVPAPAMIERNARTGTITNGYARDGKIDRYEILFPRA